MVLKKIGIAGTLESSDAMITVEPADTGGIIIDLKSNVKRQFGNQMIKVIKTTVEELEVENAVIRVLDKGALDYVLIARTKAAIYRAAENNDYKF